jgi:hypothetical protein
LVGGLITLYGYFAPFMMVGSCLAAVGCGLIYMFNPASLAGTWIGYQILTGFAFGLSFQTSIMAAQALAAYEDVATTTAILYCKFMNRDQFYGIKAQANSQQSSSFSEQRYSYQQESPSSRTY